VPASAPLIVIGASTGGPSAIATALSALAPATCPPIVVVQHMARGFMEGFAEWLATQTRARVEIAQHGKLVPGRVYVAPDEMHVEVTARERLLLHAEAKVRHQRPSADVLFDSVARNYGRAAIAVLLTGMGDDGARGLLSIRRTGAFTMAQDRESSAVYGMPAAAAERGAATMIASVERICQALASVRYEPRAASGRPS
jgi:two-component system chemotaxis response regulator CheB